jgi:hypothetical protein
VLSPQGFKHLGTWLHAMEARLKVIDLDDHLTISMDVPNLKPICAKL